MLSLIRLLSRTNKTALGRWECTGSKENKIKIDWANVDHCGTCSYKISKPNPNYSVKVRAEGSVVSGDQRGIQKGQ